MRDMGYVFITLSAKFTVRTMLKWKKNESCDSTKDRPQKCFLGKELRCTKKTKKNKKNADEILFFAYSNLKKSYQSF